MCDSRVPPPLHKHKNNIGSISSNGSVLLSYVSATVVLSAIVVFQVLKLHQYQQEQVGKNDDATSSSSKILLAYRTVILILVLWISLYLSQIFSYELPAFRRSNIPKIPPSSYLPLIPYLGQAIAFLLKRPWDLLMIWHNDIYGSVFSFQLIGSTCISLASPSLIKVVLQSKIANVKKDIQGAYQHFLAILGTGIVTSESTSWMQQRLKLSHALRSDVLTLIPKVTLHAIQRFMIELDEACDTGKEVDVTVALRHLTLQVISGTFLSISAEESNSTFAEMYLPIVDEGNKRVWHPYRVYMFFIPSWWSYHYNVYRLNTYVSKLIVDRWNQRQEKKKIDITQKQQQQSESPTSSSKRRSSILLEGGDMLDHILIVYEKQQSEKLPPGSSKVELTSEGVRQIRDEMKTFMLAGHETSAAMMTWALYELMDNANLREEVATEGNAIFSPNIDWKVAHELELPDPDEILKLILAEACLKEALRKYSVVPIVTRHAAADIHVKAEDNTSGTGPFTIPKGSTILVNIQAIHHNPKYWPNPMEYNPRRFITSDGKSHVQPEPFTFLPFIAGPRNCLGQHLSLLESKIVIGMLTQRYNFSLPKGEVLETKSWNEYDPRHRFMVPVCPQKELIVLVSKKN